MNIEGFRPIKSKGIGYAWIEKTEIYLICQYYTLEVIGSISGCEVQNILKTIIQYDSDVYLAWKEDYKICINFKLCIKVLSEKEYNDKILFDGMGIGTSHYHVLKEMPKLFTGEQE